MVIDDIADGIYTLEATVNAPAVDAGKYGKGKVLFEEDNYEDMLFAYRSKETIFRSCRANN